MLFRSPMLAKAILAAAAAGAAGCAAGTDTPDAVGYVLLDHDARAAGRLSQGSFEGAPLLPVALDTAEPVAFSSAAGRSLIDLRPGMLAWIHGPGGSIEWQALGADVHADRLRVIGTRDAASELSRKLAGSLLGPAEASAGSSGGEAWVVSAPDVFDRGSFMTPPDGVTEVVPEPLLDTGTAPAERASAQRGLVLSGVTEPARAALLVGVYTLEERALLLDAAGGFVIEQGCAAGTAERGVWHTEGDHVILEGAHGAQVLDYDAEQGSLRDPQGERYASLLADSAAAPLPTKEAP